MVVSNTSHLWEAVSPSGEHPSRSLQLLEIPAAYNKTISVQTLPHYHWRQVYSQSTARPPMKYHGRTPLTLPRDMPSSPLEIFICPMASGHGLPTPMTTAAVHITGDSAAADPSLLHSSLPEGNLNPQSMPRHDCKLLVCIPPPCAMQCTQ